jgi:mono/diheme cytochrome c family protein
VNRYGGFVLAVALLAMALLVGAERAGQARPPRTLDEFVEASARGQLLQGRQSFRFDTFGNEAFWGGTLQLHQAIAGLSPRAALALGLKVDVDVLPSPMVRALQRNQVNLDDPAVTLALLRGNAVLGVTGFFDASGGLASVGIQCALCHSVVNDSLAPGIGTRLDGWANRDLNIGGIMALAPNVQPFVDLLRFADPSIDVAAVRTVLSGWGPGKFDAALLLDGKAMNPNTGSSSAVLIPPAFGLAGVNLHTWTGWGAVSHWNAFVANLGMQGRGRFFDPRLADAARFPIAAAAGFADVRVAPGTPDLITPKLAALHLYQIALAPPAPPAGSFDAAAAARGQALFAGRADCARCHVPPLFTEPGWNLHAPAEMGIDSFQADRSPDGRYRTAPLRGLWTHQKGGFFHDGRFATLADVVGHYNGTFGLGLTAQEASDLVEYLKSL